jgi:hypothetical protein
VNWTRSLRLFINIEIEDSSEQQWSWALAVGAVFAQRQRVFLSLLIPISAGDIGTGQKFFNFEDGR